MRGVSRGMARVSMRKVKGEKRELSADFADGHRFSEAFPRSQFGNEGSHFLGPRNHRRQDCRFLFYPNTLWPKSGNEISRKGTQRTQRKNHGKTECKERSPLEGEEHKSLPFFLCDLCVPLRESVLEHLSKRISVIRWERRGLARKAQAKRLYFPYCPSLQRSATAHAAPANRKFFLRNALGSIFETAVK